MQFEGLGNLRRILCNNAYDFIYKNVKGTGERKKKKRGKKQLQSVQAPTTEM